METEGRYQTLEAQRAVFLEKIIRPIVRKEHVYKAFKEVDRRQFVPQGKEEDAYKDKIIELDEGSSISSPSLVAQMIDHLKEIEARLIQITELPDEFYNSLE
ncbi:hypothetical protein A3A48_02170 [Candidatus Curtissbacteria bacterium RIFCSPLOWO2_01_FULL_37_9]|uniref:Uncharacterized protein n=1 Tax=Candidatus Curtissbacteria bacterium RIFCSPLOWO2_01_FULL_37_9 TaxID=1797724 RepID=A0A1F5GPN0_9BACT|nr:MAG: hypothetical protein A3A48_02170 [Candidatus Curtissbacteria bacterium RIFCSPLOWO2_01_FULL_37_9]